MLQNDSKYQFSCQSNMCKICLGETTIKKRHIQSDFNDENISHNPVTRKKNST